MAIKDTGFEGILLVSNLTLLRGVVNFGIVLCSVVKHSINCTSAQVNFLKLGRKLIIKGHI